MFAKGHCSSNELDEQLTLYPFLNYASYFWSHHLLLDMETSNEQLALKFLDQDSNLSFSTQIAFTSYKEGRERSVRKPKFRFSISALHVCARLNLDEIGRLLLTREGIEVDSVDSEGMTPLMYAAERGHKKMAKLLLGKGAEVGARDRNGNTALHHAAVTDFKSMVRLLCERGKCQHDRFLWMDGAAFRRHGGSRSDGGTAHRNGC